MCLARSEHWRVNPRTVLVLLVMSLWLTTLPARAVESGQALLLTVDGPIGPATVDYVEHGLQRAQQNDSTLVILKLDTPGGLSSAMRAIIKTILNSPVPVVTYVAPSGARATSAGTYILYASHLAAMAPGTNVGAASPVKLSAMGAPIPSPPTKAEAPLNNVQTERLKILNDAVAYIESLANLRGRNAQWAATAVRDAASITAEQALKLHVINIIAPSVSALLRQINGATIKVRGQTIRLNTTGLILTPYHMDWRIHLLDILTNPNIAYILLLIGVYGLILEFFNPGSFVPGTIGGIALLLGLYAMQLLPINYAGVALILLGVALMVVEAYQPSFGVLGIGGAAAFVFGSVILMDTNAPGFAIDLSVIISFAIISVLVFVLIIGMALRARRKRIVSGREQMLEQVAIALDDFSQKGQVRVHSEIWQAVCDTPVKRGESLRVIGMNGLILTVQPQHKSNKEKST